MKNPIYPICRFLFVFAMFVGLQYEIRAVDIDPTFHPQVQTSTYFIKQVNQLVPLPDGKVIAAGEFNNYNGEPVGGLIRLNADASLDTTFNNNILVSGFYVRFILPQADGKLVLAGSAAFSDGRSFYNTIVRLTADGNLDTSFTSSILDDPICCSYHGFEVRLDAAGRIVVSGSFRVGGNGVTEVRNFTRLNNDGTPDASFDGPSVIYFQKISLQNSKTLYVDLDLTDTFWKLHRLNEDGSADNTFVPTSVGRDRIADMRIQPDGKILVLGDRTLFRINENGGLDTTFQTPGELLAQQIVLSSDGRITAFNDGAIWRFLSSGAPDPAFTTFHATPDVWFGSVAVLADGGVLIGDQGHAPFTGNGFTRLHPDGSVDTTFNVGGTGFQKIDPCRISTINVLPNGKILFAGAFDLVNGVSRKRIALLNDDSTLDTSFQINTTSTGDHFSVIRAIYSSALQADGKIIVSGNFEYFVSGVSKANVVRLNTDGSIDPSFILSTNIKDNSFATEGMGSNKLARRQDGKTLVGTTRAGSDELYATPLLLNSDGSQDTSFESTVFSSKSLVAIFDLAVQPDGKILIAGRTTINDAGGPDIYKGFVARLNADGTTDPGFQIYEPSDVKIFTFSLLPNGQTLIVSRTDTDSRVLRLNADGSVDTSFNSGSGVHGKINAIGVLPDGKILAGGLFSTYNGQARRNLAVLNADGTLSDEVENINDEIVCLTIDAQGRVLIGGSFTSIGSGGQQLGSRYLARLKPSAPRSNSASFDFDGDGKTDISVFRATDAEWYLNRSRDGFYGTRFGIVTDKIAPADYDGDGKTDIAVYRPETGIWYVFNSATGTVSYTGFGVPEDLPTAADYDGDGKADVSVFRPSTGTWYRQNSSNGSFFGFQFGVTEDKPTIGDFDGDGKADIAVFRPSSGAWYRINSSNAAILGSQFGISTDVIVPADYDGDGKTDLAVYRPSTGIWYVTNSSNNSVSYSVFGLGTDIPAPGDFDGDGRADISVFRPADGTWYRQNSSNSTFMAFPFGTNGDKPTQTAFRY